MAKIKVLYTHLRVYLDLRSEGTLSFRRVTKEFLELADIYCHRIIPKNLGGKDNFQNLVIIHRNIHQLIHENDKARATLLVMEMRITGTQLEIINQFRKKAKNCELSLNL